MPTTARRLQPQPRVAASATLGNDLNNYYSNPVRVGTPESTMNLKRNRRRRNRVAVGLANIESFSQRSRNGNVGLEDATALRLTVHRWFLLPVVFTLSLSVSVNAQRRSTQGQSAAQ